MAARILAGAALAVEEHCRRRTCRHLPHQRLDGHQGGAAADDALEAVGLCLIGPEGLDLAPETGGLERLVDHQSDLVEIERLVGVVIRAVLHRLDGRLDAGEGGQQDDQHVRVALFQLLENLEAVAVRQFVVEEDQVHPFLTAGNRGRGRIGLDDSVALLRKPILQRPANQLLVVDNENGGGGHAGH
ncbi:MAG: hypothetical protein QM736_20045 [Vicinamibacterales bacterium]